MKPYSAELGALFETRQYVQMDLYTFQGGNLPSPLRYCGGDQDILVNGLFYPAGKQVGPYFDRKDNKAKCHQKVGVEVDNLLLDVLPGNYVVYGAPLQQAIRFGLFDGAELTLEKIFMPIPNGYGKLDTSRGTIIYFVGRVAEVDAGRSVCTFSINSHLELLNLNMPVDLFMPGCVLALGGLGCGATVPTTTGSISTGSTNAVLNCAIVGTFPQGAFDMGKIVMSSGVLAGLSVGIKFMIFGSPNVIQLQGYFPTAPSPGDTFTISYGCDKTPGIPVIMNGDVTDLSGVLDNVSDANGVVNGMLVTAASGFIPAGTLVTDVGGTSVTMSQNATGTLAGGTLTFSSQNGCAKFANQARYKGFPFIPQPALAV